MPVSRLVVTDGTTEISLLANSGGFKLENWSPTVMGLRGGGTSRTPLFAPGSALVQAQYDDLTDAFTLSVVSCEDYVYEQLQDLIRLLEKARDYWLSPWSTEPVWIEAQGPQETNVRYATIKDYSIPSLQDNPFGPPEVGQLSPGQRIILTLRHELWRADEPGGSTCVEISNGQAFTPLADEVVDVPAANNDDVAFYSNVGAALNNQVFGATAVAPPGTYYNGIRFIGVAVPQGALITNAFVRFHCTAASVGANVNVDIQGELSTAPAIFQTGAAGWTDFWSRNRNTALIPWYGIGTWVNGTDYDSPDIFPIIQAIVNQAGWTSGGDMALLFEDASMNPSTAGHTRQWEALDSAGGNPPELHIFYQLGTDYGRTETCEPECFVVNKHGQAQLTDAWWYDANLGTYSPANLIGLATPFDLLPAVPANGDMVYFGIDTLHPLAGPFDNLVFDLTTPAVYTLQAGDTATISWEYWNGAWVALTVCDNTGFNISTGAHPDDRAFFKRGVDSVHWAPPADWTTTVLDPGGVGPGPLTGWWVRAVVTLVAGGAPAPTITTPQQGNRNIYTCIWPFVDIADDQVPGDVPALAQVVDYGKSDWSYSGATSFKTSRFISKVIVGARSVDRGERFTAYLNCANQTSLPYLTSPGANTAQIADQAAPLGQKMRTSFAGATAALTQEVYFTFQSSDSHQFFGEYHAYLRYARTAGADTDILCQIQAGTATSTSAVWGAAWGSDVLQMPMIANQVRLLDFGRIILPPGGAVAGDSDVLVLQIAVALRNLVAAARVIDMYDLILIPADEYMAEVRQPLTYLDGIATAMPLQYNTRLTLDSASQPKITAEADFDIRAEQTTSYHFSKWQVSSPGPAVLKSNTNTRLWYLMERMPSTTAPPFYAEPDLAMAINLTASARYAVVRGAR